LSPVTNLIIFITGGYVGYPRLDGHPRFAHAFDGHDQRRLAIVIVGAAGGCADETSLSKTMGVLVVLAAVNMFGGFMVTRRMLEMFKKRKKSL
jgi:NAD(P) transhydrogenase subunit alpha